MGTLFKNTVGTIITNFTLLLIGLFSSVIITRVLGPEGKGVYVIAITTFSLIVTFTNMGIASAANYHMARRDFTRPAVFTNTVLLSVLISLGSIVLGYLSIKLFSNYIFHNIPHEYLFLSLLIIPFYFFRSIFQYFLVGLQHIKYFNRVNLLESLINLFFIVILIQVFKTGVGGGIISNVLAYMFSGILLFFWLRRIIGRIWVKPDFVCIKRLVVYGIKTYLGNILIFLNYRADVFLINIFLNPLQLGFYATAVGIVEQLCIVSSSANLVLFPKIAAERDELKRGEYTPLICRTTIFITILGILVIYWLAGKLMILLYTSAFLPGVKALRVLILGMISLIITRILNNDLAARGGPEYNMYINFFAVLINIGLNVLWIPRIGIIGAAWASVVSYTVSALMALYIYGRVSGNNWLKVIVPQSSDWWLCKELILRCLKNKQA